MPIISSFTGIAARGLGFTNGLPPLPPTSISFSSISALNAVVTFTTTPTSYPVALVQKKIMQSTTLISDWTTITSGSNISASNLTPANSYTVYFRTQDTGGQISEEVNATLTTLEETPPGAPTFSLAVASGDAGTFKFNITWTAGSTGTYSRTTQYRVETSAGAQLTDWTTISSSPTAYGADTYNGPGALSPATTYKVRLRSVAATSGTIINSVDPVISTTGTIGAITGPGPWTATISGMSSTAGLVVGSIISATNGTGTLHGGSPTSVVVTSVASTSITYTVTGGTIPTAGTVANIRADQRITTNAIVPPNAPTDLSATPAAGTAGEFSFTFSHTQGTTPRSYPVSGSQYRVRSNNTEPYTYVSGFSTYQDFSGTITIGTSTYVDAIMSPGSTYYVDTRTYDSQGTFSAVTSTSVTLTAKRDPTVSSLTVAAPTYNGTNTTTLNVTFNGVPGTWPISSYQYSTNAGTNWKTFSGSAPYSFSVLSSSTASLVADTSYTVYVRAVDSQGNVSGLGSGVAATTNASVPSAPTLTWNPNMTSSSVDNAYLILSQPSYGDFAYVEVSTNSNFSGATTYNSSTHPTIVAYDNGLSRWLVSIGSQAFNSTYYYRAYVRNKHGATGESGYSGTRTWVTVKKEIDWSISDGTEVLLGDSEDPPTGSCANANYRIGIVMSGVSQYDYQVGYKRVTKISAELACGQTCNLRPTGYTTAWKIPSGTEYTTGLSGTLGAPFETREVTGLNITGLAVNGTFYLRTPSSWPKTSSGGFGCLPYNGDNIKGKNFTLTGKETQAGSVT
jgi:hypothetical protein